MSATSYRTADQPDVWLPPSLGRPSRVLPFVRCFLPTFALVPPALFFSLFAPTAVAAGLASVGVVLTLALVCDRFVRRRELVRDEDGRFRLRGGLAREREILPRDVVSILFHDGLRPELELRDGERFPLVWSAALDELIHVSPAMRTAPPSRLERHDYYRHARLGARLLGGQGSLGYAIAWFMSWIGYERCMDGPCRELTTLVFVILPVVFAAVLVWLVLPYTRFTEVRFLDGRRARRWLGTVRP